MAIHLAGMLLGMLLTRFGPRTPAVATNLALMAGLLWGLFVRGYVYLLAFGLFGAGELSMFYYSYYVTVASHPDHLKRNLSIYQLIGLLAYLSAALHGIIADVFGVGASLYFALSAALGALILTTLLPAMPEPG